MHTVRRFIVANVFVVASEYLCECNELPIPHALRTQPYTDC